MPDPSQHSFSKLNRLVRYLKRERQWIRVFEFGDEFRSESFLRLTLGWRQRNEEIVKRGSRARGTTLLKAFSRKQKIICEIHKPNLPQSVTTTTTTAQANTQARAGALTAHHPAWKGHHTGGSRSKPTEHPCPLRWEGCGLLTSTPTHTPMSPRKRNTITTSSPQAVQKQNCMQQHWERHKRRGPQHDV